MQNSHPLKPLWIGILCMALGVLLIYWAFHSGGNSSQPPSTIPPSTTDDEVCIQVVTSAKNPETGKVVNFPTPCDVPEGWEVVQ